MLNQSAKSIFASLQEKFGDDAIWKFLLVMPFIDTKTWKFPEWLHGIDDMQLDEFAKEIENNSDLKRLFVYRSFIDCTLREREEQDKKD